MRFTSTTASRTGRILSALAVLFLLFDAIVKLAKAAPAVEATLQLGYPGSSLVVIGAIELACVVAYVIGPTSFFGAILLTGYLGGAVATQLRVGNPLFSHVLFPTYVGLLIWGGLALRDEGVRAQLQRSARRS